jgi:hypothetical protein
MLNVFPDLDHGPFATSSEAVSTVKNDPFFEVVKFQKLLDYLHHFLVTTRKARASKANSDLDFCIVHDHQ